MTVQDPETQRLTDTQQPVPAFLQTQQTGLVATPPTSARRCQAPNNGPLSHSVVLGAAGAGGHQKPDFSLQLQTPLHPPSGLPAGVSTPLSLLSALQGKEPGISGAPAGCTRNASVPVLTPPSSMPSACSS